MDGNEGKGTKDGWEGDGEEEKMRIYLGGQKEKYMKRQEKTKGVY